MRIGAIGIDSSHLGAFAGRINALHRAGGTPCQVVGHWTADAGGASPELLAAAANHAGTPAPDFDRLLAGVDGVMVLDVDGARHAGSVIAALNRGLPVFVDKPMTCSLADAERVLAAARQPGTRCFSASCLRFAAGVTDIPRDGLGKIVAVDAFGSDQTREPMSGLWYYGCHTVEMVGAIMGPGVRRVRGCEVQERTVADFEYRDGRLARLRFERSGYASFGATVHGTHGVHQFRDDLAGAYDRLVGAMVRFFEGGPAPVDLRETVEHVGAIEAVHRSISADGAWVDVDLSV